MLILFFFFNDTATTEIYTLSLHDALPISRTITGKSPVKPSSVSVCATLSSGADVASATWIPSALRRDRKSTRLNSSHSQISYAVFCLKKKKKKKKNKNKHNTTTLR